jgi:uncharacterized protein
MLQKSEILNKIKGSKSRLSDFGVVRIGLFGSVLRNESNAGSDIDILIDFSPESETFDNYMNVGNN